MTNRYDLIKIQEKLQKKLTPDRYQHTLGVMYTCEPWLCATAVIWSVRWLPDFCTTVQNVYQTIKR